MSCSELNQETTMGKKARKRSSNPAKNNASWLWSFFSIFEFSQSYNLRKLLADRKRGSARYSGTSFLGNNLSEDTWERNYEHHANVDDCEATTALSRLPSVKTLIDEEMSKERTSKASGCNVKSNQKMTKNRKNDSDPRINNLLDSAYVALEQFKRREQVEGSNLLFDLAALIIEFYSVSRNCSDMCEEIEAVHRKRTSFDESDSQLAYNRSMLQEALIVEAEVFLSQKIDGTKRLVGNGVIHSQEFMDALEILSSNKELFLKLVQDPNSLVFSHIQEVLKPQVADFLKMEVVHCLEGSDPLEEKLENPDQNVNSISNQMFQKHKQHFLLNKKDKFEGEIASEIRNTSKERSKITVLKPYLSKKHGDSAPNGPCLSPQSRYNKKLEKDSKRTASHFSFRDIKRKLKYIIGESRKEQHVISKDSVSSIPFDCRSSADTYSMTPTENNCPSGNETYNKSKAKEWKQKVETETTTRCKILDPSPVSLFHAEAFNLEAEKHFSEMLSSECRTNSLANNQISKSLEKMISPSDLLKPELIDDTSANLNLEQSLKETSCLNSDLDVEMPVINTESAIDKVGLQEGRQEIVEIENLKLGNINPAEECSTSFKPDCSSCENCKDGCSTPPEQCTPNEKPRILIPTASISSPRSIVINHFDSSELVIEKPERPSPVSVLEPFFLEDDASPDRPSIKFNESHEPLQPIHLNFHEDTAVVITASDCLIPRHKICSYDIEIMIKYVRTMLETSSFDSEMSPERWLSSELLLQPSLSDQKLLLDCVNEVLSEMKDWRRFQISPWLSFFKPNLKDLIIQEVCKTIKSYLSSQVQSTINEIMSKDMGSAMWMDHRLEMESVIAEMVCNNIFEELMEEEIFELFFL